MKKIQLDLDDLKVETFETLDSRDGSVFGLDPVSCPSCGTCPADTCGGDTCADSCSCSAYCTDSLCGGGGCGGSSGGKICV
jgi:hypothetical protein